MSSIAYIHGIPQDEIADRAREIPRPEVIDYSLMTEGELRLSLMREQLQILSAFYPEVKDYRTGLQAIEDTLQSGLHAHSTLSGFNPGLARYEISRSRFQSRPAVSVDRLAGLGGVADECAAERQAYQEKMNGFLRAAFWNKKKRRQEMEAALLKLNDCLGLLDFQRVLNDHLESSSHHLLYKYVPNPNAVPNVVSTKAVNHRVAIENLAQTSGLSLENVATWVRNGVMRNNAKKGIEPYQPEETINIMATEIPENPSAVSGAFLAALPVILKAVAAAASATAVMIAAMKQEKRQQFTANLQGMGNPSFGPQGDDWLTGTGSGAGQGSNSNILPIAVAAAGLLYLNS